MRRLPAHLCSCPICGGDFALAPDDRSPWRCPAAHSFDVARDGSVHLLPAGHARKVVGDSVEMLQARQRFFARGHYTALTSAIADAVVAAVRDLEAPVVVDLGCGEGSHTAGVLAALGDRSGCAAGVDLAKDAVRLMARRCPDARGLVADCGRRLPFRDGVVDVAMIAFAPRHAPELARVVAPGGCVVVALPRPTHLREVVDAFGGIGMAQDKIERLESELEGAFEPASRADVDVRLALDADALADLIGMTPHARHVPEGPQTAPGALFSTSLSASVVSFRRR